MSQEDSELENFACRRIIEECSWDPQLQGSEGSLIGQEEVKLYASGTKAAANSMEVSGNGIAPQSYPELG